MENVDLVKKEDEVAPNRATKPDQEQSSFQSISPGNPCSFYFKNILYLMSFSFPACDSPSFTSQTQFRSFVDSACTSLQSSATQYIYEDANGGSIINSICRRMAFCKPSDRSRINGKDWGRGQLRGEKC